MFFSASVYLDSLFDMCSSCFEFYFSYHQCVILLSYLNLYVYRSVSGKHLVLPYIGDKNSYFINDEEYYFVDADAPYSV